MLCVQDCIEEAEQNLQSIRSKDTARRIEAEAADRAQKQRDHAEQWKLVLNIMHMWHQSNGQSACTS